VAAGIAALLAALVLPAGAAQAADAFPQRPVRWVVPYPPGGGIDVVARVLAARLSQHWGNYCVVENRPGEGGRTGVQAVIAAAPDGYTQLMAPSTNYTLGPGHFKGRGYDAQTALAPVTLVAATAHLLVGNLAFPPKTIKELVALAKARPGAIHYGSSGVGSPLHLTMALFNAMAGIDMTHAPYTGGAPAITDVTAGQIQLMFINAPAGAPWIKDNKVRALGVSTARRSAHWPEIPTIAESGVPGFDVQEWYGLALPAGAAPALLERMHRDVTRVLHEVEARKQLMAYGVDPLGVTSTDMAKRVRAESAAWTGVIQRLAVRVE
jgi:tripartite-type tricarboxylate transporter receptor subunit TctC